MEPWDFEENEFWWDIAHQAVKFDGWLNGERFVFAISQIALNDYYRTPDTKEDALQNFGDNIERIEYIAARYASECVANEEAPHFFITSEIFAMYTP